MANQMQFFLFILLAICCCAMASPRLKQTQHHKQKHGENDGQQQQMPRRVPFPHPGQMPDYLQEASDKAQIEYKQIFEDEKGQMPKGELKEKLKKWAESNGIKEEYDIYQEENEQKKESYHKIFSANLGGDALKVFKKIWEITHNDELSRNDECQQLQDALDGLKQRVRNMVPLMPSGISGAPPAPGCFPSERRDSSDQLLQSERRESD
uniref:Putative effector protein n=1 Tax=Heterodera avenae TaxID=34510 RepID=A0A2L0VDK6_HETAV|nr:putative effector protein [Heterodera avenae]